MSESNLFVTDPSATPAYPTRKHDIAAADGRIITYEFEYGRPTSMPETHAYRFLASGFLVSNSDGAAITPTASVKPPADGKVVLGQGEVIARLDELTAESLVKRASALPGGEKFNKSSGKAALISFLRVAGAPVVVPETADGDLIEDPAAIDQFFDA